MSAFQLLPSQLLTFNDRMIDALSRRGDIEIWSSDCEQYMVEIFKQTYGTSDINVVLDNPAVYDWLIDQAVNHRKLSFKAAPQIVEKIVERPVEVVREVEKLPRRFPGSRITSSVEIAEAARKRVDELQQAAAIEKIVEQQVERYNELRSESLYATGGSGTHSANNYARAQAKQRMDQFVATMHPATRKYLGI